MERTSAIHVLHCTVSQLVANVEICLEVEVDRSKYIHTHIHYICTYTHTHTSHEHNRAQQMRHKSSQNVAQFKHFRKTLTNQNYTHEEMNEQNEWRVCLLPCGPQHFQFAV